MIKQMNPVLVIAGVVIALCLAGFVIYRQTSAPTETVNTTFAPAEEQAGAPNTLDTAANAVSREQSPGMQP